MIKYILSLILIIFLIPNAYGNIRITCIYNKLHFEYRDVKILESKRTNAYAVKLLKPVIYITKPLLNKLTTDEALAFIIAHEEGHIKLGHLNKLHLGRSIKRELEAYRYAIFSMLDKGFEYKKLTDAIKDFTTLEEPIRKSIFHTLYVYKNRFRGIDGNNSCN